MGLTSWALADVLLLVFMQTRRTRGGMWVLKVICSVCMALYVSKGETLQQIKLVEQKEKKEATLNESTSCFIYVLW